MPDDVPRTTLTRVLEELSETLLTVLCGTATDTFEIGGVVFHDPIDDAYLPRHALVLGIGLRLPTDIIDLLDRLQGADAAALVVRSPLDITPEIAQASERSGVPLVGLARGASWAQLAAMIRALSVDDLVGGEAVDSLGGVASGDLFALANAITAIIDAPITILDRSSRVLAFSGRQTEGDASRVETILGRQVPERFTSAFVERGVFDEMYRSDAPVWIESGLVTDLPRIAMAVRAGDEVLGSIWAVVREPLSEQRTEALTDAVKLVALHMLRIRGGLHGAQQLRADLVSTALAGGPGAGSALGRLGLADEPVVVFAMGLIETGPESVESHARGQAVRQRLSSGLAMHLTAVHPRCATALIGDVCYALMPAGNEPPHVAESRAVRIAGDFLARADGADAALIGVGPVSTHHTDLASTRRSADRVLNVLLDQRGRSRRVALFEDVHVETLLLELREMVSARGERPTGAVARLVAHDAAKNTQLVETLRAWLNAFGNVTAASAAILVHPNTFRYRLSRVVKVSGLDLDDSEARFAAALQLRVLHDAAKQPSS